MMPLARVRSALLRVWCVIRGHRPAYMGDMIYGEPEQFAPSGRYARVWGPCLRCGELVMPYYVEREGGA